MRLKFFFLFLDLYLPVLAINNAGIRFFHFSNFFAIFFVIFFPSPSTDEMRYKNFCFLFLPIGVLAKNNVGKRFFNILIFFFFFLRNFLARVENERNSGLKFFSLFLGLSHPVLAKNNVGKRFFLIFSNFFAIFFGILLHESSMNGIRK